MRQPNNTNGSASITIDKKIVLICKTEFGKKENMISPLTLSYICQNNIRFPLKKNKRSCYNLHNSYFFVFI